MLVTPLKIEMIKISLLSNGKVANLMPTLGITQCGVLGKALKANILTSGGATQWIRAEVGNRNISNRYHNKIFLYIHKSSVLPSSTFSDKKVYATFLD